MESLKATIFVLTCSVILFSCNKVKSDFILSKTEYSAGEELQIVNDASNFKNQLWSILSVSGDTVSSTTDKNPNIKTSLLSPDGVYFIELKCWKKKEDKNSISQKQLIVKSIRTTLNITSSSENKSYSVYIDGEFLGHSSSNGDFSKLIPIGLRYVELHSSSGDKHSETIEFRENYTEYIHFY